MASVVAGAERAPGPGVPQAAPSPCPRRWPRSGSGWEERAGAGTRPEGLRGRRSCFTPVWGAAEWGPRKGGGGAAPGAQSPAHSARAPASGNPPHARASPALRPQLCPETAPAPAAVCGEAPQVFRRVYRSPPPLLALAVGVCGLGRGPCHGAGDSGPLKSGVSGRMAAAPPGSARRSGAQGGGRRVLSRGPRTPAALGLLEFGEASGSAGCGWGFQEPLSPGALRTRWPSLGAWSRPPPGLRSRGEGAPPGGWLSREPTQRGAQLWSGLRVGFKVITELPSGGRVCQSLHG